LAAAAAVAAAAAAQRAECGDGGATSSRLEGDEVADAVIELCKQERLKMAERTV
jgi:hypothetical protein